MKETGDRAESLAVDHLKRKGLVIVERNWHNRYAEIDIIARDKETIVFVEVRSKTGESSGLPEETIDFKKQKQLKRAALIWSGIHHYQGAMRIDAVCIVLTSAGKVTRLDYYENIIE